MCADPHLSCFAVQALAAVCLCSAAQSPTTAAVRRQEEADKIPFVGAVEPLAALLRGDRLPLRHDHYSHKCCDELAPIAQAHSKAVLTHLTPTAR